MDTTGVRKETGGMIEMIGNTDHDQETGGEIGPDHRKDHRNGEIEAGPQKETVGDTKMDVEMEQEKKDTKTGAGVEIETDIDRDEVSIRSTLHPSSWILANVNNSQTSLPHVAQIVLLEVAPPHHAKTTTIPPHEPAPALLPAPPDEPGPPVPGAPSLSQKNLELHPPVLATQPTLPYLPNPLNPPSPTVRQNRPMVLPLPPRQILRPTLPLFLQQQKRWTSIPIQRWQR